MRALGEATGASRAYVFENVDVDEDEPFSFRRAGWASGEMPTIDHPQLGHVRPAPHFPRWARVLAAGEALSSRVRELPDDEREVMELIDALSVVAVPVFVEGSWWGFIGFEDCERERDWSAAETDALRAAAGLIAAGVSRDRVERDLRRAIRSCRRQQQRDGSSPRPAGATRPTTCSRGSRSRPRPAAPTCSSAKFGRRQVDREPALRMGRRRRHRRARQPADAGHVLRRGRARSPGPDPGAERALRGQGLRLPRSERAVFGAQDVLAVAPCRSSSTALVGLHRLRRLQDRADVERRRAGCAADGVEPARGGGPPRALRDRAARARAEAARRFRHRPRRDLHHRRRAPLRRRQPRRLRVPRRGEAGRDRPQGRRVPACAQARNGRGGLGRLRRRRADPRRVGDAAARRHRPCRRGVRPPPLPPRPPHRLLPRRHRAQAAGGGPAARTEAREPGPPGRRRRPRLQQPPDRDHRLRLAAARARERRRRAPPRSRRDRPGGRPRRRADEAAARLRPAAGAEAAAARPEHGRAEIGRCCSAWSARTSRSTSAPAPGSAPSAPTPARSSR